MPSTNSGQHEEPPEDFEEVLRGRCYHEAAHAVFACHDGTEVDEVWVSDKEGTCTVYRADLYEQYLPLQMQDSASPAHMLGTSPVR